MFYIEVREIPVLEEDEGNILTVCRGYILYRLYNCSGQIKIILAMITTGQERFHLLNVSFV